jgi:predicted AAA+ superfamily ATPase
MPNWYNVATPHEDIRKGDFDESDFAAKLGDVVDGVAAPDYNDPYVFYKKNYLTKGLKKLLQSVYKKLDQGRGPGVVQLQTPFGGGKTHALILVYHYLSNGERVEELLPEDVGLLSPNIATIVGTDANPSEGFRDGDVHRQTLWGEIAYQLGGAQAYEEIRSNDENGVSLGRKDLRDLLKDLQPFTILLDEVLQYVGKAMGVEVGETTLGAETLSFCQELTEAVSDIDNGLLLATLPSSEREDFSDVKAGNLAKLQKIFGRLEAIYTPVEGEEIYSIIRRRLFETPDEPKVRSVVDNYVQKYQEHEKNLPGKATSADFRKKMELAYPFHPEVIDILHEKWSTYPDFQKTRGVLQLLARVVEDLYQREKPIDLILPGDINLEEQSIRRDFLRYIGNEYEGIIASDVAGSNAKSVRLDQENKAWNHLAERNATSIFLHSFAADEGERGIDLPFVKLDVARPDTTFPLITEVLNEQEQELWYLNTRNGQEYYFSNVPNLNRMVVDKKGQIQPSDVRSKLESLIREELGTRMRTYLWPKSGDELPDNEELKLAVLDPSETYTEQELRRWVNRSGQSYRSYKNTIFFARADEDRYARIQDTIKDFLALQNILDGIRQGKHSGLEEKESEVQRRLDDVKGEFSQKIRDLYHVALVPVMNGDSLEEIDFGQSAAGRENLDSWFRKKLASTKHSKILERPPSANLINKKFLGNSDTIELQSILDQFYKDPNLPALDQADLIAETVANGVQDGSFGLARCEDGDLNPNSVRINEALTPSQVNFREEGWVLVTNEKAAEVQPDPADGEEGGDKKSTISAPGATGSSAGSSSSSGEGSTNGTPTGSADEEEENLVHRFSLRASEIPTRKLTDLNRGVLMPITRDAGEFTFTIEFEVESTDGISEQKIEQTVMETLRQLGATVERKDTD